MVELQTRIQQVSDIQVFDELVTKGADYAEAKAAALNQIPTGWRVASFMVLEQSGAPT